MEFNWGIIENDEWFKSVLISEIFEQKIYEKYFVVEPDDVVLDVGASIGPFTCSILQKKPKQIFCLEPKRALFNTLVKNISINSDIEIICINQGLSEKNGKIIFDGIYQSNEKYMLGTKESAFGITFKTFIELYDIEKIHFLKTDCEGGEYDIQ